MAKFLSSLAIVWMILPSSFVHALPLCEYRGLQEFDNPYRYYDKFFCHIVGYGNVSERISCAGLMNSDGTYTETGLFKESMLEVANRLKDLSAQGKCQLAPVDCKVGIWQYPMWYKYSPCHPKDPDNQHWRNITYLTIGGHKTYLDRVSVVGKVFWSCYNHAYTQDDNYAGEIWQYYAGIDDHKFSEAIAAAKDGLDVLVNNGVCTAPRVSECEMSADFRSVRDNWALGVSGSSLEGEWISRHDYRDRYKKIFVKKGVCLP